MAASTPAREPSVVPPPTPIVSEAEVRSSLERHRALVRGLSRIQQAIGDRVATGEILNLVVEIAEAMFGDEQPALLMADAEDPELLRVVASRGFEQPLAPRRLGNGVAGRAAAEGRLVVVDDYRTFPGAIPAWIEQGTRCAMAAPVREGEEVIGSLLVSSRRRLHGYSGDEQEMLEVLARHASLALQDARLVANMSHQALHDVLTGLPNRALFRDRLEHALARAERRGETTAVLFCDLDRFKTVNDSLGHSAGDQLLCAVGDRLSERLRDADTAARFGGDEFAVLLEDIGSTEGAMVAAERLLEALSLPLTIESREWVPAASIGVAVGSGPAEELLRCADAAMYRAKARGRNRIALYEPAMRAEALERLDLEAELRRALADPCQLAVHLQPLVELRTRTVTGFEALVRWPHSVRGTLGPEVFLPIAEETGGMAALTRHVLRTACAQAVALRLEHPDAGLDTITVNVATKDLERASLVDDVRLALEESGLPAPCLVLEILETELLGESDELVDRLHELKRLGVRLALDDFGTGWSSLQYLRRFPVDVLKMAKPFVDGLSDDATDPYGPDADLALAIVELAGSLGLHVIAEGVEEHSQAARLRALGCGYAQGHLFSPALSPDALRERLNHPPNAPTWRLGPAELEEYGLVRLF